MKLERHLTQGHLVYLSHQQDAMTVSENAHFRWMAFNDVVQSVMHIRKPLQLTLPHQIAILLPLLFFKPKKIIELGLGGGNLTRFLSSLSDEISLSTIEYSQGVIDTFEQYFNPNNMPLDITCADGMQWLTQQVNNDTEAEIDWVICDVYQSNSSGFNAIVSQLEVISSASTSNNCISINLPEITDSEVQLCSTILQQLNPHHKITYFTIPNYLNIIMHLTPNHWHLHKLIKNNKHCYLPTVKFKRWKSFWQQGLHTN